MTKNIFLIKKSNKMIRNKKYLKKNVVFLAKIGQYIRQAFFKILKTDISIKRYPLILDYTPKNFNSVQFRRIWW